MKKTKVYTQTPTRKLRVYLAGPMRGYPNSNREAFLEAGKQLEEMGYEVVNPAVLDEIEPPPNETPPIDKGAYPIHWFMKRDLPQVLACDQTVVLPGWELSEGASIEVSVSLAAGMPVRKFGSWEPIEALTASKAEGMTDTITDRLKKIFPHGHENFIPLSVEEMGLHSRKNYDYASGGDPLGNFIRVAKILSLYPGFPIDTPVGVLSVYVLKQLDAVLWGLAKKIKHVVEGLDQRLQDISVYSKIARILVLSSDSGKENK